MIRWTTAAVIVAALEVGAVARAEAAECKAIEGTVETHQTSGVCASSPVGICFEGSLRTTSALRGDTFFVVEAAYPDPSDPSRLVYTGTLTVRHPSGAVFVFDTTGSVDQLTGAFVERDVARSPNEATLTITGNTNATLSAFSGSIGGQVCEVSVAGD